MQTAYVETCTSLFKYYDKQLALFLANKIEHELAIDQTFTPTRYSEKYIITDPKLTTIRDDIADEMRSLSCYHRSPFLCEYLINALTVTQPDVRPMHFILKCPLQDSRGGHSLGCRGHSLPRHEHEICDCCSVRNLATLNKAISPTFGMGIRSLSFPCPTFGHDAQPLMTLFSVVLPALVRKPHLYAKGVWQISGFRLTVATLSGSVSNAHHFIDKFRDGVDERTYICGVSSGPQRRRMLR
jgi:hypothetical protein